MHVVCKDNTLLGGVPCSSSTARDNAERQVQWRQGNVPHAASLGWLMGCLECTLIFPEFIQRCAKSNSSHLSPARRLTYLLPSLHHHGRSLHRPRPDRHQRASLITSIDQPDHAVAPKHLTPKQQRGFSSVYARSTASSNPNLPISFSCSRFSPQATGPLHDPHGADVFDIDGSVVIVAASGESDRGVHIDVETPFSPFPSRPAHALIGCESVIPRFIEAKHPSLRGHIT